jgi:ADP-heptose:LPS heptosyltransferase
MKRCVEGEPARGRSWPARILAVRTDRIGDLILSLPAIQAVRKRFPDADLEVMVAPATREVVERSPSVDGLLIDDRFGLHCGLRGFAALLGEIRREKYDVVLLFHPTLRLALLFFLARVHERIGTASRFYSPLFTRRVWHRRSRSERHESDYCLELAGLLGVDQRPDHPLLDLTEEDRSWARERLADWGVREDHAVVIVHPGSGGSARDWPADRYRELVRRLAEDETLRVVVTGTQGEAELVCSVAGRGLERVRTMVGKASIPQLSALLEASSALVTNSTGPLHLAAAVGTPTVSIFCPIVVCAPRRWGPLGDDHRVLVPDVPPCRACTGEKCKHYDCMALVSIDKVIESLNSILESPRRDPRECARTDRESSEGRGCTSWRA